MDVRFSFDHQTGRTRIFSSYDKDIVVYDTTMPSAESAYLLYHAFLEAERRAFAAGRARVVENIYSVLNR